MAHRLRHQVIERHMSALHSLVLLLATFSLASPSVGDYDAALTQANTQWADWAKESLTGRQVEKAYSTMTVADDRLVIWYPKGTSKSKLKSFSVKTIAAFDKVFDPGKRPADAPERRTAVLFPLSGPKSFTAITSRAAELVPRLSGWAQAAPRGVGFLLDEPLAGGWLLDVPDSEVWNGENELANRLTRLLTIERFGRQPHWLSQGLAWHVELTVCKDVYCFPFRTGFISKKEHKTWPRRLTDLMSARGETPVVANDLFGWQRNTWSAESAALAWGAVAMLAKHYEEEFPKALDAFRALRIKDGRQTQSDGSWTVIPDYEIPAEQAIEILDRELGVDFLAELDRYARKPKTYRRPR